MDYSFLTSNRFWFLILGSASAVLVDPEISSRPLYYTIGKFLGLLSAGFIVIRSTDRATEVLSNRELPVDANQAE